MSTNTSERTLQEHAKERAAMMDDYKHGRPIEGLSDELGKISQTIESSLRQKGTGAEQSVADVLEAQRRLVEEKDLANRFVRIKQRLEDLKGISTGDPSEEFAAIQRQMESLRPLVVLILRSSEFRDLMSSTLILAKKLIKRNKPEGAEDKVAKKTKEEGIAEGAAEAKKQVKKMGENIQKKVEEDKLITDEEWSKLTDKMDATFRSLQKHKRYREGVDQLFDLGSFLRQEFDKSVSLSKKEEKAVKEVKKEAMGLLAEFSGEDALNDLVEEINSLYEKFQNDEKVSAWWEDFKAQIKKVGQSYKSKEDLKEFRKLFNEGEKIFDDFSDDIDKVIDQMKAVVDNITNDKFVKALREKVGSISDELVWKDANGNSHIDTDAAKSLAAAITDAIRTEFKYLALPGIRYKDGDTTLTLKDIIVSASLPDNISFHLESYANFDLKSWNLSKPGRPDLGTEIYLTTTIKGITFAMKDAHFDYEGTMITDSGIVSIRVPKPGADLTIDFVLRPFHKTDDHRSMNVTGTEEKAAVRDEQGRYSLVKVKSTMSITDLDVDFDEARMKHPYLIPTVVGLFKSSLIDEFEGIIERLLNDGLKGLGENVAKILNQAPNPLSLSSLGEKVTGLGGVEALVE